MITAVIPVKKNSSRCSNKNIRYFSDSNLLKKKIVLLKQVKNIDKILVSSDCDKMLKIAEELNVLKHKRTVEMCDSNVSGSDLYISLAREIDTEHMLLTFCVTPFVKRETYEKLIEIYNENLKKGNYDSISTVLNFKHYIWCNNEPVNYKYDEAPPTQLLPDYYIPTYGINLTTKKFILENKNVIGKRPYFYNVDQIESIDIDTPYDFLLSEMLNNNHILNSNITKNILKFRENKIELIDSTLINNNNNLINECYNTVSLSKFDYFEIDNYEKINLIKDYNHNRCKILFTITAPQDINLLEINKINKINSIKIVIKDINDIKKYKNLLENYEIILYLCFERLVEKPDLLLLKKYNIKIKGIIIKDNGLLNENNILKIVHNIHNIFNDTIISLGIDSSNIHLNNLAIFHGCNLLTSSIGGIDKYYTKLKTEELLYNLYLKNRYNISNIKPIIEYYDKHIESKQDYIINKSKYHPYYILSSINQISYDKIYEILNDNTDIEHDLNIIIQK